VLDPKLLSWFGNTWGRAWFELRGKQTTNLASLSLRTLKELPVPVPPKDTQDHLVDYVSKVTVQADKIIGDARQLLRKLNAAEKSLLQAALTGRIVPQNPRDEPAEVLLERLRAETADAAASKQRKPSTRKKTASASKTTTKELA
jgi:type I restriction enzyme S subunit